MHTVIIYYLCAQNPYYPAMKKSKNSCCLSVLWLFICLFSCVSCHKAVRPISCTGENILIDSSFDVIQDTGYIAHLSSIKARLEEELRIPIGYAPQPLLVYRPECSMLNWACDALLSMARQSYSGRVDMSVVNIGGMRCEWAAGDVTYKDVFELMPFDNELVVLTLTGAEILRLCEGFVSAGGEGVAGLRLVSQGGQLESVLIGGKVIVPTAYYTVATSDYLSQGNDHMDALAGYVDIWRSEQKIRDLYIRYVQQVHIVEAHVDGRMSIK